MTASSRSAVRARFDAAALSYDAHATVQRRVAGALAQRIAALALPGRPLVLEIGCGTGLLAELVLQGALSGPGAVRWLASDLSPAMAARCRDKLGRQGGPGRVRAVVMDGARPALSDGSVDLVCSSMALQWFAEPERAVGRWLRLLRPGGAIAVATLLSGSLANWYAALAASGIAAPLPPLPGQDEVRSWFGDGCSLELIEHLDWFDDPRAFVRSLKAIGANAAPNLSAPVRPAQMRAALRRLGSGPVAIPYRVALVVARQDV